MRVEVIKDDESVAYVTTVSDTAKEAVRIGFNPSQIERVNRLKAIAAAFISECEDGQRGSGAAAREYAVAITNMQTASMWGVLAATKNAP